MRLHVCLPQDLEKLRNARECISDDTIEIFISTNTGILEDYLDEVIACAPLFERFPGITLSLLGDVRDAEFLRHFPSLGGLKILSGTQTSYEGLRYVPRLEWLHLGGEGSLEPLKYVPKVRHLELGGPLSRLESVGLLPELEELMCPALQPPSVLDFAQLTHLSRLHMLQFNGASAASLDSLADFPDLRWLSAQCDNWSFLEKLYQVRWLLCAGLNHKLVELQQMCGCEELYRVEVIQPKSLAPLADIPHLHDVIVWGAKLIDEHDLSTLKRKSSLKEFRITTGKRSRDFALQKFMGLPEPPLLDHGLSFRVPPWHEFEKWRAPMIDERAERWDEDEDEDEE